jgi:hypothetical protein
MTRRKVFYLTLEFVAIAGVALFVFWWPLVGWLRQESFYKGQPTSYWEAELQQWERGYSPDFYPPSPPNITIIGLGGGVHNYVSWRKTPSKMDKWKSRIGMTYAAEQKPPLLDGDPAAEAVLNDLLGARSPSVRELAEIGLLWIEYKRMQTK